MSDEHIQYISDSTTLAKNTEMPPTPPPFTIPPNLKFGNFIVSNQVFHISQSRLTFGLVNIKPLLPGHILVCPVRSVPRLSMLSTAETSDLFCTVRRISRTLERVYLASGFNVAVQDGGDAGQSVAHVHVHVIPRRARDMDARGGGDVIYEMMDGEEGDVGLGLLEDMVRKRREADEKRKRARDFGGPDAEAERRERSEDVMREEAEWLRIEMEKDEGVQAEEGDG